MFMNDRELSELMDLLYPYFVKKLKADGVFKNCIKSINATVTWVDTTTKKVDDKDVRVSNIGKTIKIKFPYDSTEIDVINKSTSELDVGNLVCVHYFIDLKNAYVAYKV
jgi:hypothetical protein